MRGTDNVFEDLWNHLIHVNGWQESDTVVLSVPNIRRLAVFMYRHFTHSPTRIVVKSDPQVAVREDPDGEWELVATRHGPPMMPKRISHQVAKTLLAAGAAVDVSPVMLRVEERRREGVAG